MDESYLRTMGIRKKDHNIRQLKKRRIIIRIFDDNIKSGI